MWTDAARQASAEARKAAGVKTFPKAEAAMKSIHDKQDRRPGLGTTGF